MIKLSPLAGIYDLYIDFPQQKITIIGWADPEKIVKAIKKTRKMATICNIEQPTDESPPPQQEAEPSSSQPTEPEPEGNGKAPEPSAEATQPHHPTEEAPPAPQGGPPEEPPKDTSQPEQPPPAENNAFQQQPPSTPRTRDVGEVHVIHQHHPPNYGNRYGFGHSNLGHWDRYHNSPVFLQESPQPVHVTHSYNAYRPSTYVTEYENVRSPPWHTHYNRMEYYGGDYHYYHNGNGNGNGNITSMFSDENPNACTIV